MTRTPALERELAATREMVARVREKVRPTPRAVGRADQGAARIAEILAEMGLDLDDSQDRGAAYAVTVALDRFCGETGADAHVAIGGLILLVLQREDLA